jgi:hypothetical protein
VVVVRKDYAAPTELENLMIPISTNMPRLTALGISVRVFRVVRGQNGTAKYANHANNGRAVSPLTAAGCNECVLVHHDGAHGVTRPTTKQAGRAPWWPCASTGQWQFGVDERGNGRLNGLRKMIELTLNKDGGFVKQWCAKPTVYLDHWAWIKISKDEVLAKRFSRALKARNGTLAFSWLNIIEFSKVTDEEHGRKANVLLDAIWPQVFVLYPNFFKVIEQENKILCGGERFAPHGDLETLRSILKISPFNPNAFYPLRAPKLFDLAAKTGVTFDENADLFINQIASWRQDYCNNPEFNSTVKRTPKTERPKHER